MLKKSLLPMNLQLFASSEVQTDNIEEVENTEEVAAETTESNSIDSEKVIEKLQKRLGKETSEKNETKEQLEKALLEIDELKKASKKGVKELSEEDKAKQEQNAKDSKIKELENQIKIQNITSQVDEVLKESGFALNKEELSLVVNSDEEVSYSNVQTLISLINRDREQQAIKRNTGVTPKAQTTQATTVTREQFDAMSYAEKSKLATNDPTQFKKLTGGQ